MIINRINLKESIEKLKDTLIDCEVIDRTIVKPFGNTLIEIRSEQGWVMFVDDEEELIIENNKPIMTKKVKTKDLSEYLRK